MILLLAVLGFSSIPGLALAQQPPSLAGPAGVYTITAPGPVTLEYGVGYVTIRWATLPAPVPGPTPPPAPTPPPPAPTPKYDGPVYLSLVLPAEPTVKHAAIRDQFVSRDWAPLKATVRAYLMGQAELDTLGLSRSLGAVPPPCVIVQTRPESGDRWPVAGVWPVQSIEDIDRAIAEVRK